MSSCLVIVSNRLPISVRKSDAGLEFYPSVGGLATGLAGYTESKNNKWIGWPGIASDNLTEKEVKLIKNTLNQRNCYPVFLTQQQLDNFYNGYSNSILWPLFHNLKITDEAFKQQEPYWEMYQEVNELYSKHIMKICDHECKIWINDYHLLLLPAILRKKHLTDKIGFFAHIPFPNAKSFASLNNAKELVLGILGSELVGFHTKRYVNNFLKSCQLLKIGIQTEDCIALDDRVIRVSNFPMGIDYKRFNQIAKQKSTTQKTERLKTKYLGQKVILTVDRLDPTKGLIERLQAYQNLLSKNEKLRENVVLIMLTVPSRTDIKEYSDLKHQLDNLIAKINQQFKTKNWLPIDHIYDCLPIEELVSLYQVADVAFITPLADGMNLVAKEFVASKQNAGVLILSKTAGTAEELRDALIVDPKRPSLMANTLAKSMSLSRNNIEKRLYNMKKHVATYTVQNWANNFLDSLADSPIQPIKRTMSLSNNWQTKLVSNYHNAIKRTFLLDYDGTLAPFVNDPNLAMPSENIKSQLHKLGSLKRNSIFIISGRGKDSIGEWFRGVNLSLVVEHGGFVRLAGSNNWRSTKSVNGSWKPMIQTILDQHAEKVPGAFVEQKSNSLVWHYRAANQLTVKKYLESLKRLLLPLTQRFDLKAEQGNMILEIRPNGISKADSAIKYSQHSDFILAIGDDTTDEEMFLALPPTAWTIKVGTGITHARFRLRNVDEVHNLLNKLASN